MDIEQIKREVQNVFTEEHRYIVGMAVSYLHSRGYLGDTFNKNDSVKVSTEQVDAVKVLDARLELEYERGRRDALMNLVEAAAPKGKV